jgi:hypothetical protein
LLKDFLKIIRRKVFCIISRSQILFGFIISFNLFKTMNNVIILMFTQGVGEEMSVYSNIQLCKKDFVPPRDRRI